MKFLNNIKYGYLALGIFCCSVFITAIHIQQHYIFITCALCELQRIITLGSGLIFIISFISYRHSMLLIYATISNILLNMVGLAFSLHHVWIQNFSNNELFACSGGLSHLFKRYNIKEISLSLWNAGGDCARSHFSILGIELTGWVILVFVISLMANIYFLQAKKKRATCSL